MKLYIGGVYQGQEELARAENPGLPCYPDFHEAIRRTVLEAHQDPREFARQFCAAHPDAIVVANEVGAGVVPIARKSASSARRSGARCASSRRNRKASLAASAESGCASNEVDSHPPRADAGQP